MLVILLDLKDIEYDEKKAKKYSLPDGIEFYVIDDVEEAQTEAGVSIAKAGAEGKRGTKRVYHALIIRDPEFGMMPMDVWREKRKQTILGTMSAYEDVPHMDIPHADSINVTASGEMYASISCKKCGRMIPRGESRCPYCGAKMKK